MGYGAKVCNHCHKRGHIQYTCKKLKKDLQNLKLSMVGNPTMEVENEEKLKEKN